MNEQTPERLEHHHRQALSVTKGTVVPLSGEQYLHHTHTEEMEEEFREWETGLL